MTADSPRSRICACGHGHEEHQGWDACQRPACGCRYVHAPRDTEARVCRHYAIHHLLTAPCPNCEREPSR